MFKECDVVRLKVDKSLSKENLSSDRYQSLSLLSAGAIGTVVHNSKLKKLKNINIIEFVDNVGFTIAVLCVNKEDIEPL